MEKDNYHLLRRHDVIEGFLLHDNLNVPMHSFPYKKEFIKTVQPRSPNALRIGIWTWAFWFWGILFAPNCNQSDPQYQFYLKVGHSSAQV